MCRHRDQDPDITILYPQQREPAAQLHPAVPGGGGRRGRGSGRGGGVGVQPRVPAPLHLRWDAASVDMHMHIIVCIFQWTLELTEWAYEPKLITWNFEKEITSNNTGFQMHVGDIHQT